MRGCWSMPPWYTLMVIKRRGGGREMTVLKSKGRWLGRGHEKNNFLWPIHLTTDEKGEEEEGQQKKKGKSKKKRS